MLSAKVSPFSRLVRRTVAPAILALLAVVLPVVGSPTLIQTVHAATNPCAAPVVNAVACENTLPGTPPSQWDIAGSGDSTIQGYGTSMSVNVGGSINFKIKSTAKSYHIDILRLGYYQGNGARRVAAGIKPAATLPQTQPACLTYADTGLVDCGNWAVSASWSVPATAVSGVYIALLVRDDTGGSSQIPFVVRNDAGKSDIVVQTSDETWQAYNTYGGNNLYSCTVVCPPGNPSAYQGAFKVSYNRPFHSADDDLGRSWLDYAEYPMIRFLEANGYDVSYISGLDTSTQGSLLLNHKVFISSGHDEYWSGTQRANVENARDHGVNLAFFSGNEVFWRTRWEPSQDGTNTPNRTLVAYKDTHFDAPTDPVEWTGSWRDPRFGTATGGGNPENSLTGQIFLVNSGTTDITVPAQYAQMRLWRNTAAASLTGTQSLTLGAGIGTLGYEWDVDSDDGFRPAGNIELSSTTFSAPEVFTDYGSTVAPGTATHHLTMYKAPSGALVFGAGTVQWAWGLDGWTTGKATDKNMQQATVNLFADMGAQPATLMTGLIAASPSSDTSAPTSVITSPAPGASIADGTATTISGTASDAGGGVVAGVEVSTDGGTTWHPATGTTAWTYSWVAHGSPKVTIKVRATDDSGNIEGSPASTSLAVNCPCSVFGATTPTVADSGDGTAVEVGMKFTSDVTGNVNGIRFYKSTANTGTHIGNLWSASGTLLASATFTSESASGWQYVSFPNPVTISAGTTYIASYYAPKGHYSQSAGYMYNNPSPMPLGSGSLDSAPLHGQRNLPGNPNGLYSYSGSGSTFPTSSFNAENYWVDLSFTPGIVPAPAVASTTPANNVTGVASNPTITATFNQGVTASSIGFNVKDAANNQISGSTSYNSSTNTATFTPSGALTYSTAYTATISGASNGTGQTMAAPFSWTFTTGAPPPAPTVSSTSPGDKATGVSIGATVSATFNQPVTPSSIGFTLKDGSNNPVPGSSNYNSTSNVATFTPTSPLAYSTSYTATVTGATNPSGQTMASPYTWTFTTAAPPPAPAVNSTAPLDHATGVPIDGYVSAKFNQAVTASSIGFTLKDAANNPVAGTTSYDSTSTTAKFTPSSSLAYGASYTATVTGATNPSGQTMTAPYTWSFTTAAASVCPCSIFSDLATPASMNLNDGPGIELGMKFRSDVPGTIRGVRFYKGSQDSGTHTGYLWSGTGALLTSVTFTNESASGWQQALFSAPVAITAGTTYVVSYYSPKGYYSANVGYFSSAADSGPLHGLADGTDGTNGLYRYGDAAFPTGSYNQTNYWVDVLFSATALPAPTVSSTSPSNNDFSVAPGTTPSATFSQSVTGSSVSFSLKDAANNAVPGSVGYDPGTNTSTFTAASGSLAYNTTYTATVSGATGSSGQAMTAPYSWTFTTTSLDTLCPCSVFNASSTPSTTNVADTSGVELGMKFRTDVAGSVTGIRFYKGSQNTGTHTGYLWSGTGSLLASVTFSNESASGWQQAMLSTPVAISPNTTYVVSYYAPNGYYSANSGYFSSAADNAPLHGLASGTDGPNGLFRYGNAAFPTDSYNNTNYWVDVVFTSP